MTKLTFIALFLALLSATGCKKTTSTDAGVADSGEAMDSAVMHDAGGTSDSAVLDAGTTADSAVVADLGSELDAGDAPDAGEVDSGTDADAGPCSFYDTAIRTCGVDDDCRAELHQINCCGTVLSYAVNVWSVTTVEMDEPTCRASYPHCGCPTQQTMTDSGEVVTDPTMVNVACVSVGPHNYCKTYINNRPPNLR